MYSPHYYPSSAEIRREASLQMKGRELKVVILYFVPVLISVLITGTAVGFGWTTLMRLAENGTQVNLIVDFFNNYLTIGVAFALLDMIRYPSYEIRPLKDAFQIFTKTYFIPILIIQLVQGLFIFLWSLLLLIPGIIKGYAYSQAFYIYKDNLERNPSEYLSAVDCITESRQLMDGHKFRLFQLHLSFIGWYLLEVVTFGVASIFVRPYIATAEAVCYDNLIANNQPFDERESMKKTFNQYSSYLESELEEEDDDEFADF